MCVCVYVCIRAEVLSANCEFLPSYSDFLPSFFSGYLQNTTRGDEFGFIQNSTNDKHVTLNPYNKFQRSLVPLYIFKSTTVYLFLMLY